MWLTSLHIPIGKHKHFSQELITPFSQRNITIGNTVLHIIFLLCIRLNLHIESFTQQSTVSGGKKPKLYVKLVTAQGNWRVGPLQKNFTPPCGRSVLEWKQLYPTAVGCFLPVTSAQLLCKLCHAWRGRFLLDVIEGWILYSCTLYKLKSPLVLS